ncbi:hypothetical protein ATANTOWER_021490 [Ataeniobius toweri]|uniref:Uncharacterized protein n=1 Tax=Ataeniobius toweri TaxID=208326 RepID=A0ABU7BBF6_9TELE|nr:hypothetical protein [Ataeniobius toweri]
MFCPGTLGIPRKDLVAFQSRLSRHKKNCNTPQLHIAVMHRARPSQQPRARTGTRLTTAAGGRLNQGGSLCNPNWRDSSREVKRKALVPRAQHTADVNGP